MGGGGGPGREIPEQVIQDALNNEEDFTLEENETTNLTEILIIPEGRTLTNNGTIDLGEAGLQIEGNLINNGTITNNQSTMDIYQGGKVENRGTIILSNGTVKYVGDNTGQITLKNEGIMKFETLSIATPEDVTSTVSLSNSSSFIVDRIEATGPGELAFSGFGGDSDSRANLKSTTLQTSSSIILKNLIFDTTNITLTSTASSLSLENTALSVSKKMEVSKASNDVSILLSNSSSLKVGKIETTGPKKLTITGNDNDRSNVESTTLQTSSSITLKNLIFDTTNITLISTASSLSLVNTALSVVEKMEVSTASNDVSSILLSNSSSLKVGTIEATGQGELKITGNDDDRSNVESTTLQTSSSITLKNLEFKTSNITASNSVTIDNAKDSSLTFNGDASIEGNIKNQGLLQLNNITLTNTGTINNEGTIKQFENTNSSIEADSFGKIITTGTVTGLNLKNQQITTDGDGTVIAGTKNEADKILNAKTIVWDAKYNPGDEEDYKVKRTTADHTKYEIEFVQGKVTFLKEDIGVTLPNGGQPYSPANNPGFTLNTWYKEYDGDGDEQTVFGIQDP